MVDPYLSIDAASMPTIEATLTVPRLSKYLQASNGDLPKALRLYVANARLSAAIMADLHYVEVALRNKFDRELAALFSTTHWFSEAGFTGLLDFKGKQILAKSIGTASKGVPQGQLVKPGKVVAELTFGFWIQLTNKGLTQTLWTPGLYKAFLPGTPPKRATFNAQLERLRVLRNRIAHHEPVFQMPLQAEIANLIQVSNLLCSHTTALMQANSTTSSELAAFAAI